MEAIKMRLLSQADRTDEGEHNGPVSGQTIAVPRFKRDLEALLLLAYTHNQW
jgi:hypothetical protein